VVTVIHRTEWLELWLTLHYFDLVVEVESVDGHSGHVRSTEIGAAATLAGALCRFGQLRPRLFLLVGIVEPDAVGLMMRCVTRFSSAPETAGEIFQRTASPMCGVPCTISPGCSSMSQTCSGAQQTIVGAD
jgi:hypothetical protein